MLSTAEATPHHSSEPHHDWAGNTRAVCTWNVAKGGRDESRSSGWIQMARADYATLR